MAVGQRLVVARLHPGQVVHTAAPAAGPVGAVAPGVELPHPLVIRHQAGEDLSETIPVAEVFEILPLAPRHDIRPGGGGIEPGEMVAAGFLVDLAADIAVRVLMGIEVVKRALKIEHPLPVFAERTGMNDIERR